MRVKMDLALAQFAFTLAITLCLLAMSLGARSFSPRASYFPFAMGLIGGGVGIVSLLVQIRSYLRRNSPGGEAEVAKHADPVVFSDLPLATVGAHFVLFIGFLAGIAVVGMHPAVFLMVMGTQRFLAGLSWFKSILSGAVCLAALIAAEHFMRIRVPPFLLSDYLGFFV